MRILRNIALAVLITSVSQPVLAGKDFTGAGILYSETPAKTICIKSPAADNTNGFFSSTTTLFFEVYKAGNKEEIAAIVKTLSKNSNVRSCSEGLLTGDYQAFTIDLKSTMDKAAFVKLFKSAGLNTIKINNNPVVAVDKM